MRVEATEQSRSFVSSGSIPRPDRSGSATEPTSAHSQARISIIFLCGMIPNMEYSVSPTHAGYRCSGFREPAPVRELGAKFRGLDSQTRHRSCRELKASKGGCRLGLQRRQRNRSAAALNSRDLAWGRECPDLFIRSRRILLSALDDQRGVLALAGELRAATMHAVDPSADQNHDAAGRIVRAIAMRVNPQVANKDQ